MDPFTPSGNAVAMASPMNRPMAAPRTNTGKKTPEGIGRDTAITVKRNWVKRDGIEVRTLGYWNTWNLHVHVGPVGT